MSIPDNSHQTHLRGSRGTGTQTQPPPSMVERYLYPSAGSSWSYHPDLLSFCHHFTQDRTVTPLLSSPNDTTQSTLDWLLGQIPHEDIHSIQTAQQNLVEGEFAAVIEGHTDEQPSAALLSPNALLSNDHTSNQALLLEQTSMNDWCFDPSYLSPEQPGNDAPAAAALELDTRDSVVPLPPTDAINTLPSDQGWTGWDGASLFSNSTISTSATPYTSPPSYSSHLATFSIAPTSTLSIQSQQAEHCVSRKRRRDEDGAQEDSLGGSGNQHTTNGEERPIKKKKRSPSNRGAYFCPICSLLQKTCQLSRKDALKRHINLCHTMFAQLLDDKNLKLLEPVKNDGTTRDNWPLFVACLELQRQAKQRGEEIKEADDLAKKYPMFCET